MDRLFKIFLERALYSFLNERFDCVRNNGVLIEEKLDGNSPPRETCWPNTVLRK